MAPTVTAAWRQDGAKAPRGEGGKGGKGGEGKEGSARKRWTPARPRPDPPRTRRPRLTTPWHMQPEALAPPQPGARLTPYTPGTRGDTRAQATGGTGPTPTGDPADHVDAGPARRHPGAGTLKRWPHPNQGPRRPRTRRPPQTGPGRRQPEALAPTPARDTTDPVHVGPTKRHPGAGNLKRWPHTNPGPGHPRTRRPHQTAPGRRQPEAPVPYQPGTLPTQYTPAPPNGTQAQATVSAGPTPTRDPANHVHAGNPRRHPGAGNQRRWPHPSQGPGRQRTRRPRQTTPGHRQPEALAPPQPCAWDPADPVHAGPARRHPGTGYRKRRPHHHLGPSRPRTRRQPHPHRPHLPGTPKLPNRTKPNLTKPKRVAYLPAPRHPVTRHESRPDPARTSSPHNPRARTGGAQFPRPGRRIPDDARLRPRREPYRPARHVRQKSAAQHTKRAHQTSRRGGGW